MDKQTKADSVQARVDEAPLAKRDYEQWKRKMLQSAARGFAVSYADLSGDQHKPLTSNSAA